MASSATLHTQLKVQMIQDFPFPEDYSETNVLNAMNFSPRDSDVIIIHYPECSSSWVDQCLWKLIKLVPPASPLIYIPLLENVHINSLDTLENPRVIKSSLPYRLTKINPNAKYIYITRHPKDLLIAFYLNAYEECDGKILRQNFFEDFNQGRLPYGDYFHHACEWFQNRNDNIFFLNFESMHINPKDTILTLAIFLGISHQKACLDERTITEILEYPFYDYRRFTVEGSDTQLLIRKHILTKVKFRHSCFKPLPFDFSNYIGISWNHLNDFENREMNRRIAEEFGGDVLGKMAVNL